MNSSTQRITGILTLVWGVLIGHATRAHAEENSSATQAHLEPPITDSDRDHWSFRPLTSPAPPDVANADWCRNDVDRFVLARIEEAGLVPLGEADRETLLRRVTFDLSGLPPTTEQREQFLDDNSDDAYEKLVDRLLASHAYAERQAQHWLDLARFAETDGFEHDHVRPDAWKYRDWVIDAFDRDLPYPEFLRQQLSGDLMPDGSKVPLEFLIAGPDMPDINSQDERRHFVMNDATSTVGSVILGLQLGCAACHDHKYDPVSQYDFYRLRAYFEPVFEFKKNKRTALIDRNESSNRQTYLMIRGDFRRHGPPLKPAVPRIATQPVSTTVERPSRLDLAQWMGRDDNRLVTRVIVNRLWAQHFQRGISPTPSDFGIMGQWPTHPELLDYLARRFVRDGWSFKSFHRLLVTSTTYRLKSRPGSEAERTSFAQSLKVDPNNELLCRYPLRRLSAEEIRDAMLLASGELNRKTGGPGFRPPLPDEVVGTLLKNQWNVTEDESEHTRRSVYLFVRRNLRYPLFDAFDKPDTNLSCARRNESTIAPQALILLNSQFSLSRAQALSDTVANDHPTREAQITDCYLRCLGRLPTEVETRQSLQFLDEFPRGGDSTLSPLGGFCLALFNLSEFLYLD